MRSRVSVVSRASVTVVTFLGIFLGQEGVKAQVAGFCDRTMAVRTAILGVINNPESPATVPDPAITCMTITQAQLAGITELDLSSDGITSLESGDFAGLTMLQTLNLSVNGLTTLDENIFSSLGNLQNLSLNNNTLTALPSGIFSGFGNMDFNGLTNLRILRLNNNNLEELPAGLFSGLNMLTAVLVDTQEDAGGTPIDTLPLDVRLQESDGGVVVEVVQGVPFTSVTATLTISGGTFVDGTISETETEVTLNKGETRSSPITIATESTVTISITATPNPAVIETGFDNDTGMGYSGFTLASGPALTIRMGGICSRTQQVQDAIMEAIMALGSSTMNTCDSLIFGRLMRFIRSLDLSDPTPDDGTGETADDITSLQSGDFAGLTGMRTLNLSDNSLGASDPLPTDIFDGLGMLQTLNLSGNDLTMLDANIFDGLTDLTTLNLMNNALETLPRGIFSNLNSLTSVRVEGQTVDGTAVASLPLDVTLKAGNVGMAIVEVVQGVPFTSVTVNLSISGGNFGTATDTTTSVTISTGETESAPFAFNVTDDSSPMPQATISIAATTSSTPANILTGITDTRFGIRGF